MGIIARIKWPYPCPIPGPGHDLESEGLPPKHLPLPPLNWSPWSRAPHVYIWGVATSPDCLPDRLGFLWGEARAGDWRALKKVYLPLLPSPTANHRRSEFRSCLPPPKCRGGRGRFFFVSSITLQRIVCQHSLLAHKFRRDPMYPKMR